MRMHSYRGIKYCGMCLSLSDSWLTHLKGIPCKNHLLDSNNFRLFNDILNVYGKPVKYNPPQDAKKVSFTAFCSGKLYPPCTSQKVISSSPPPPQKKKKISRAVTKISSTHINTTSRLGIKQLYGFLLLLFFFYFPIILKYSGVTFLVAGGNPRPLPLNDSPG